MFRLFVRINVADYETWRKAYDQFYGERGGRLRDPFGHQWMLSKRTERLSSEETARRAAAFFGSG